MKTYFSHGKESGPWGFKIKRLAAIAEMQGCAVESIDYRDEMDPDERVQRLLAALAEAQDDFLLVGSSMGGYVALVASESVDTAGVFLIAPAIHVNGFGQQTYQSRSDNIDIVHGWSDDIIPVQNSIRYAREADCSLHLISGDHPLNDSIKTVEELFERFLRRTLALNSDGC